MSSPQFCNLCNRNVAPQKQFNWLVFIFLCGCFYLPFYLFAKAKCPICQSTDLSPPKRGDIGRR
ncbi:hypothetical protein [Roseateles chitosanitabidus]|uniref:hypothetical protein n=1 Tax=Roseateles chitosanitabidus TaxID=65048 RepID=UPI000829B069|nr:hypothetical protein [Roseateles chitosanitabidus]MBO9685231.1 hypothetical protein [Roseateles chitosanitabidus]